MNGPTLVVIAILAVIILLAVRSALPHFKGEGGCCGGGDDTEKVKKKKLDHVSETRVLTIEGMYCEKCVARVERALNALDHVSARVHLKKNEAVVSLEEPVDTSLLIQSVEQAGYSAKLK